MKQEIIRIDLGIVNCYLGKAGDDFILFDTGGHIVMDKQFTNRREKLQKELDKAGCTLENLKLVVLTHGDNDHVANAAYIRSTYKTKIAMHAGDLDLVESPSIEMVMKSFRYSSLFLKIVFQLIKKPIRKITLKTLDDFETFTPDFFIDEGYRLSEYGFDAVVLHLPGHTDGSIGILAADGSLIVGDTLANPGKPGSAPNAVNFKTLAESISRLKALGVKTIYPGHGNPFTIEELIK